MKKSVRLYIEGNVQGLKEQLDQYQRLLREFERDRTQKYGNLENELKNASLATGKLQEATTRLNNILGNVKLRGQWGETSLEAVMGQFFPKELYSVQHYFKNGEAVDAVLKLPNNQLLPIDSKFNWENFEKMVNSDNDISREQYKKTFFPRSPSICSRAKLDARLSVSGLSAWITTTEPALEINFPRA